MAALGSWTPPVDIEETDEAYVVEVELPGVRAEDAHVGLDDSRLSVHGEVKERVRTGVLRRSARRTGRFDYRVTLPAQVDGDEVEASLEAGVLRLELPKFEAAKPRRIEITGSSARRRAQVMRPRRRAGPLACHGKNLRRRRCRSRWSLGSEA